MNLLPVFQIQGMAFTSYGDFLRDNPVLPALCSRSQMLKRVGEKLITHTSQLRSKWMTDAIGYNKAN
jgi:hypothetical protein